MCDVTEESLLDYFYSTGGSSGKVKNADLLKTYKPFIGHNDLQLRAKYREEFKVIMDRIAVVKSENGDKYLVLRKKYKQMLVERDSRRQETLSASAPARAPATVPWEVEGPKRQHQDLSLDSGPGEEDRGSDRGTPSGGPESSEPSERVDLLSAQEYESEQDEEGLENMASVAVSIVWFSIEFSLKVTASSVLSEHLDG
ncbi:hypothetical protein NHX12_012838 [Muraenolepis orangiensis]|uniref:SOWAHA-C winged helix-turn-helix domain-containing protein n=1 Tax=Muraenolepis orangiensis TaxID=630683 RepID=A0A9Q0DD80_9TELE|nr:hypothetical protein NHX12_012838 [Muraenolepis orangiensis]